MTLSDLKPLKCKAMAGKVSVKGLVAAILKLHPESAGLKQHGHLIEIFY